MINSRRFAVEALLVITFFVSRINCCDQKDAECKKGLLLPVWEPLPKEIGTAAKVGRAIVYITILAYVFFGKSIICDKFMEAIEYITSRTKEVKMKRADGEVYVVHVKKWNATVASLTLMALGSSAPEILISVIEICGNGFKAGELGPGSIVGSAAFNLFIIVPICVWTVPCSELRRIKHIDVFWVTAIWSVFAYIWLYLILAVITPNELNLWEALLTLIFFPLTVITAYIADRKYYRKFFSGRGKFDKKNLPMNAIGPATDELAQQRQESIRIFKELRAKFPDASVDAIVQMAEKEIVSKAHKSYAYHRIEAMKKLTGGGDLATKRLMSARAHSNQPTRLVNTPSASMDHFNVAVVYFEPAFYTCREDVGTVPVRVKCERNGLNINYTVQVNYRTEDGTALAGSDYEQAVGTLFFAPGEEFKEIPLKIIDDAEFEVDEHFSITLYGVQAKDKDGVETTSRIVAPSTATVMIMDDDHYGAFGFETEKFDVFEAGKEIHLKVIRTQGCKGDVLVPYKTASGTAVENRDFIAQSGKLHFKDSQMDAIITIPVITDEEYEIAEYFFVELGQPFTDAYPESDIKKRPLSNEDRNNRAPSGTTEFDLESIIDYPHTIIEKPAVQITDTGHGKVVNSKNATFEIQDGRPILTQINRCKVVIKESKELKGISDKIIADTRISLSAGTTTWKEQFHEALSVSSGSEDENAKPDYFDYVMHVLSFPWKICFAFVPPTVYWGGWLCFLVSLGIIGFLTTLVIDLASHFGCTVGLDDMILSITIIALGTSLPDVYASKIAALHDETADASIVNITGANAVNVFLGIGIAWTIASAYHLAQGDTFEVLPGSMAFNVTLFCIEAVVAIAFLQVRRYHRSVQGELGGRMSWKLITIAIFVGMWVMYLLLSSLEVYCVIHGF